MTIPRCKHCGAFMQALGSFTSATTSDKRWPWVCSRDECRMLRPTEVEMIDGICGLAVVAIPIVAKPPEYNFLGDDE